MHYLRVTDDLGDLLDDLTVSLPDGDMVDIDEEPAFWISYDPAPTGLWAQLREQSHLTGLWPVLVNDDEPWWHDVAAPEAVSYIDQHDPTEFMAEIWRRWVDRANGNVDLLAPFGEHCPGLTASGAKARDPEAVADWHASMIEPESPFLALVPVYRGADAITAMGWEGALGHSETVPLSAMVRTWEERFGARLVRVGRNSLTLSIAGPPVVEEHALHVAAEHWAFCPDNLERGAGALIDYGKDIQEQITWNFTWHQSPH